MRRAGRTAGFVFERAVVVPIPLLIPLAVLVVPAVTTAVVAVVRAINSNLSKKLDGKKVAILGPPQVGKTTLLRYLESGSDRSSLTVGTVDSGHGGRFELRIDGAVVTFEVPRDVPGNQGLGFPDWHAAISEADYIWYLFRGDLVSLDDAEAMESLRTHLGLLQIWLGNQSTKQPKVVLIGTHVDEPPGSGELEQITERIQAIDAIKLAVLRLKARIVIGSLADDTHAGRLRDRLGKNV